MPADTRYVIIRDESAGNETVGEMWKETKIFPGTATLDEVMEWALKSTQTGLTNFGPSRKNITITKPHGK